MGIINKMEALIGNTFKTENGTISLEQLQASCDVIAVYFSAHWCPPCRGFTPVAAQKYNEAKSEGTWEVVFVSSDRDAASFNEYYGEQPWVALPFKDNVKKEELSTKFGVNGIPCMILLNGTTGEVINSNCRSDVQSASDGKALVNSWG